MQFLNKAKIDHPAVQMEPKSGNKKTSEKQLKKLSQLADKSTLSEKKILELLKELDNRKQEIEKQTQQLIQAKKEVSLANKKYIDLYEEAPTGYFTISSEGKILELNRRGAQMLQKNKKEVINKFFSDYILPETKPIFNQFLTCVFQKKQKQSCEVTLECGNNFRTYIYLSARKAINSDRCFVTAVDLSEWKTAEQNLAKSEERYRKFFENNNAIILFIDPKNGKIIFANQAASKFYGYTKHELEKMNISQINILPEKEIRQKIKEALRQKQNYYVFKHRLASGEIRDVEVSQTQLQLNNQLLFSIIVHDITKRKTAENSMLESEERFNLVMQATKDGIFDKNLLTNEIYFSPGWKKMLGYRDNELPNHSSVWEKLISPEDLRKSESMMEKLIERKIDRYKLEFKLKHKNGHWIDVMSRAEAIFDKNGKAIRIVGTHVDISDRKRSEKIQQVIFNISNAVSKADSLEKLLRQVQTELGTIIDTTNFYVALYDQATNKLTLPFCSDEKDNFAEIPAGKILTNHVIKCKQPLLATRQELEKLLDKKLVESFGSAQKVWLGVPLKIEGKVTGVIAVQSYSNENAYTQADSKMLEFIAEQIGILIDRKNAEEVLRDALKKAKESDRLKSAFLATISHELRTPLNAIIGFSDFLDRYTGPDEVEKFSTIIKNSGYHLLSIVNDLFDLTLIQSGETKINKEEITVNSVLMQVQSIIADKQRRSDKTHIELQMLPNPNGDALLYTDANKLKQILINLLKNALKFTEKGWIKYGYKIREHKQQKEVMFFVKDSGIGIDKSKHSLIFDMFRQVDDHSTRRFGGTGIGLSVAKQLTQILGGQIWVESEMGKGSTFYFTIPLKKAPKQNKSNNQQIIDRTEYSKKIILIVEDDRLSFEYARYAVKSLGINWLWAKNGKEAIDIYSKNRGIDLVLMDINMPVMDGFEATQKLKNINPDLPIIAQTAHAIAGDREKILLSGCDDYLSKPISKKLLVEMIDKYLG